jgi:hypothetical protein
MEFKDGIAILGMIVGIMWGAIQQFRNSKLQSERDNSHAIWKRIDELKHEQDSLRETLRTEYMTGPQVQHFVQLSNEAWLLKLEHIETQLTKLEKMIERLADK